MKKYLYIIGILILKDKSVYKGVFWKTQQKRWRAQIQVNGKKIYLGNFVNKEEAAKAYDEASIKYFGEFARTNYGRNS